MKNILKYGAAACGVLALATSCDNDEFLATTNYEVVANSAAYENDDNAKSSLTAVYVMMRPDFDGDHGGGGDWGFKPNLFTGCHPTMDTQATGWDKDWNVQKWNASSSELLGGWKHAYVAVGRANEFITNIGKADVSSLRPEVVQKLTGEAYALHGFFTYWLATTFRKIPLLLPGENYINTPTKSNDISDGDLWDGIIEDFKTAAEKLDWTPLDKEYGRATKGMALAYLADAYMWKAYRCPDVKAECYKEAKAALKQIIDSKTYELNKSFTTLWDCAGVWDKEAIWVEVLNEGSNWGSWDKNLRSGSMFTKYYTACPENGGWGSLYLSWEWYASYEKGDKRREGSCCTGKVLEQSALKKLYNEYAKIYKDGSAADTAGMVAAKKTDAEISAKITELWNKYKYIAKIDTTWHFEDVKVDTIKVPGWRQQIGGTIVDMDIKDQYVQVRVKTDSITKIDTTWQSTHCMASPYWFAKDYDEAAKSYGIVDVTSESYGVNPYLSEAVGSGAGSRTGAYHFYNGEYAPSIWSTKFWRNATADWSSVWAPTNIYWKRYANVLIDYAECCFETGDEASGWAALDQIRERAFGNLEVGQSKDLTKKYLAPINGLLASYGRAELENYPLAFSEVKATVEDAKTYYTKLAANGPTWFEDADRKPFKSAAWKVAVNMERRKEFNTEWCLRPDMQRSGFMAEHIEINYPKRDAADLTSVPWTNRSFDYDDKKMDMPIPQDELIKNPACVQNEAYR